MRPRLALFSLLFLGLIVAPVYAIQVSGPGSAEVDSTINVTVTDGTGSVVPNATVTFELGDSLPITQFTDENGTARFKSGETGVLKVTAEKGNETAFLTIQIEKGGESSELTIDGPSQVKVGKTVTIQVTNTSSDPVTNATVTFTGLQDLPVTQFSDPEGKVNYRPQNSGTLTVTAEKNGDKAILNVDIKSKSSNNNGGGDSGGSSGGGGGASSPAEDPGNVDKRFVDTIWTISKGETVEHSFEAENGNKPVVESVTFIYDSVADDVRVELEELKSPSTLRETPPPGKTYRNFNLYVSLPTERELEKPTMDVKVEKEWLEQEEVGVDQLRLARWSNDEEQWNLIDLTKTGETDKSIRLTAELPGFSQYAITAVKEETTAKETTTPTHTPTPTETPVPTETPAATAKSPEENVPGFTWFPTAFVMIAVLFLTRQQR